MVKNKNHGNPDFLPAPPPEPTYQVGAEVYVTADTTLGVCRTQGPARVMEVRILPEGRELYDVKYIGGIVGGGANGVDVSALAPLVNGAAGAVGEGPDSSAHVPDHQGPQTRQAAETQETEVQALQRQLTELRNHSSTRLNNSEAEIRRLRRNVRDTRQREQEARAAVHMIEALLEQERINNEAEQTQMMRRYGNGSIPRTSQQIRPHACQPAPHLLQICRHLP